MADGPFACPCCGAVSHHPQDAEQGYCSACHWWTGDPQLGPPHMAAACSAREKRTARMSYPHQVTRYYCPIGACDWWHDAPGPSPADGTGTTTDEIVFSAVASHLAGVEVVIRAHLETHPLEEWAREVTSLRAPVPGLTAAPWRQGRSHPSNLWAVTGDDWREHQPIGRMDSAELAAEAVAAHNARLDLAEDDGLPAVHLVRPGNGQLERLRAANARRPVEAAVL